MTEPAFTVALPPEWKTSEFRAVAPMAEIELPGGRQAMLSSVLLEDGSSVMWASVLGGLDQYGVRPGEGWDREGRLKR